MATWTLKGEAGKTFPAVSVSFEDMGITDPVYTYNSMENDELTFLQRFNDARLADPNYARVDLVTGEAGPRGVFATNDYLYWVDNADDSVMRSDLGGANVTVMSSTNAADPYGLHVDDTYIYWCDNTTDTIQRMLLDGTGQTTHITPGTTSLRGLFVTESFIYWSDTVTDGIYRANLDGTGQTTLVSGLGGTIYDLSVSDSYIYYTNDTVVERRDLDGTNPLTLINTTLVSAQGICHDDERIYFSDNSTNEIYQCDLDGSNFTTLLTGLGSPRNMAIQNGYVYYVDSTNDTISRFSSRLAEFNDLNNNGITDFGYPIELSQTVNVYRDAVRVFSGLVTSTRIRDTATGGIQKDYTVSGPWWWLEQTPLTGDATDQSGGTKERISVSLATGDLKTHIQTIINRSITLGCDVSLGTIATCFDIPQITLKQMSCAEALSELVRWIPDAMVWIDYTAATPSINLSRRSTADVATLTIGQPPCVAIDVNPRYDLETEQVVLTYVDRGTDGKTVYNEQISGATPAAGRRQIFTVSGPELDSFLPNDFFQSYTVADTHLATTSSQVRDYITSLPLFAAAVGDGMSASSIAINSTSSSWYCYASITSNLPPNSPPGAGCDEIPATAYTKTDGSTYSPTGKYILAGETPPQWLIDQLDLTEVILTGTWVYEFIESSHYFGSTTNYTLPSWAALLPSNTLLKTGYTGPSSNDWELKRLFTATFEVTAWMDGSNTTGVQYRDPDYEFVAPPSGLAAALKDAQGFQPYEGQISIAEEDALSSLYRGKTLNISGGLAELASMKAMVQGVSIDVNSGLSQISLGTPRRLSYQGLVNRFRRTASDNIIYL